MLEIQLGDRKLSSKESEVTRVDDGCVSRKERDSLSGSGGDALQLETAAEGHRDATDGDRSAKSVRESGPDLFSNSRGLEIEI